MNKSKNEIFTYWRTNRIEAASKCKTYTFENNLSGSLISVIQAGNIASKKVGRRNDMNLKFTISDFGGHKVNF